MPDRPWKQAERHAAALFDGKRLPANSGGLVDFETARFVGQVKNVRSLSLEALTQLAAAIDALARARGKVGVVVVKVRRGQGRSSPFLVVFTEMAWQAIHAARGMARITSQGVEKEGAKEH